MRRVLPFLAILLAWPLSASALWGTLGALTATAPLTEHIFISQWKVSTAYEAASTATDYVYVSGSNNTYIETTSTCTSASSGAGPTGTGTGITDGSCSWNFVHSGSNIVVPANYLSTQSVEAYGGSGGGGDGTDPYTNDLSSGGGGAYAAITSYSTTVASVIAFQGGVFGAGAVAYSGTQHSGVSGTASWFGGSSCGAANVCADFGVGGGFNSSGTGGLVANSVGSIKYAGGSSGLFQNQGAPGAGGMAGPHGAGGAGGNGSPDNPAGGGGGADGGSAGAAGATGVSGGVGGTGSQGTPGAGAVSGTNATAATGNSGGGGAYNATPGNVASSGACSNVYDAVHPWLCGGGGGASGYNSGGSTPGNGGSNAPNSTNGAGGAGAGGGIVWTITHS